MFEKRSLPRNREVQISIVKIEETKDFKLSRSPQFTCHFKEVVEKGGPSLCARVMQLIPSRDEHSRLTNAAGQQTLNLDKFNIVPIGCDVGLAVSDSLEALYLISNAKLLVVINQIDSSRLFSNICVQIFRLQTHLPIPFFGTSTCEFF